LDILFHSNFLYCYFKQFTRINTVRPGEVYRFSTTFNTLSTRIIRAMSEQGPNSTIDGTKSMPCIELAPPILDESSDHSFGSYKSFNTLHEWEVQDHTQIRTNVKALIDKHRSFQENLLINVKVSDSNYSDQKSFANDCERLSVRDNDCIQMKGDTKQVENVEDVVR